MQCVDAKLRQNTEEKEEVAGLLMCLCREFHFSAVSSERRA